VTASDQFVVVRDERGRFQKVRREPVEDAAAASAAPAAAPVVPAVAPVDRSGGSAGRLGSLLPAVVEDSPPKRVSDSVDVRVSEAEPEHGPAAASPVPTTGRGSRVGGVRRVVLAAGAGLVLVLLGQVVSRFTSARLNGGFGASGRAARPGAGAAPTPPPAPQVDPNMERLRQMGVDPDAPLL